MLRFTSIFMFIAGVLLLVCALSTRCAHAGKLELNRLFPYVKPCVWQKQSKSEKMFTGIGMGYKLGDRTSVWVEHRFAWNGSPQSEVGLRFNLRK